MRSINFLLTYLLTYIGSIEVGAVLQQVVINFQRIHQGAPRCLTVVVYSGNKLCSIGKMWCLQLPCFPSAAMVGGIIKCMCFYGESRKNVKNC